MTTGRIVPIELLSNDVIIIPRLTIRTTYLFDCIVVIVNFARRINKRFGPSVSLRKDLRRLS
jgi:hypothetical protein